MEAEGVYFIVLALNYWPDEVEFHYTFLNIYDVLLVSFDNLMLIHVFSPSFSLEGIKKRR